VAIVKGAFGKHGVDLHALRVFLAVAESNNMTIAARKCGLTQSAVSQLVRQLEESLGTVLVDRSQRPIGITATGRVLHRHALTLIQDAEALEVAVRHANSEKVPELRIGVIDSFASTVGPSLIKALLKSSATQISFRSGLAHDQSEGLLNRSLDFIITSDALDDVDGLERRHIFSEPFLLLLPDKLESTVALSDLNALAAAHPLIRFSTRGQIGLQIERHLRRVGVRAPRLLEVDATDTLATMVSAGLGWAIATPLCLLQVKSSLLHIKTHPFPGPRFVRHLYLVNRIGEYGSLPERVTQDACDIVREECLPEIKRLIPWLKNQIVMGD
jgi:DNA-binding transcriptional LysR family regulator